MRFLLACAVISCSSPSPRPTPRDGKLHTIEIPEPGGTHLKIAGFGIPLSSITLPEWMIVPIGGTVDVAVDLHIPTATGYAGATGEATLRCASGCTVADGPSDVPIPKISVDRLEARAVFANGRAELATWTFDSKDVTVKVVAQATLARSLLESQATACIRFASKATTLASNARLAPTMAEAGIALDVNGLWNIKLAGRLDALAVTDFGCDGATPPSRPPPDPIEGIQKLTDTRYEISRAWLDAQLANPMEMAKGARIVPAMKDGKPDGFKLYAIRPESVFARLGLTNGDTVLSINGILMNSADEALEFYSTLRDATSLEVKLTRQGAPLTLTYVIK